MAILNIATFCRRRRGVGRGGAGVHFAECSRKDRLRDFRVRAAKTATSPSPRTKLKSSPRRKQKPWRNPNRITFPNLLHRSQNQRRGILLMRYPRNPRRIALPRRMPQNPRLVAQLRRNPQFLKVARSWCFLNSGSSEKSAARRRAPTCVGEISAFRGSGNR